MVYQTGRNILVAYKPETEFGVRPANDAARVFRPNSGTLNLTKAPIASGESRRDGMSTRGRHGSRSVAGSYVGDLSLGTFDPLIEAGFRGTFTAPLALTALSLTVNAAARTITRAAGSWITDGVRVGDVIRFSGFTTTANNGRNVRVVALTATVMTVAETLTTVASAENGISLARPKKLIQGQTPRSFTFEEAELDIDGSEIFTGNRVGQLQISLSPNGMGILTVSLAGQNMDIVEGAQSPYFANPVATTSIGMTAVEAVIRLGDEDVLDVTALTLSVNLNANGQAVVGSVVTPDVFTNQAAIEASITALRKDVTRSRQFLNEDQLSLHILFTENESEPRDFCSLFLGNLTLSSASKSELGSDGPRTQTLGLMVGIDERGGAFDPTMIKYQTSAA